jgi:hypothetical protein
MGQLAAFQDAGGKRVRGVPIGVPVGLQDVTSAVRERQNRGAALVAQTSRHRDQAGRSQPIQIAMPEVGRPAPVVVEITDRDGAERPKRGQGADLRPAEVVLLIVDVDALALDAVREIQVLREYVARVDRFGAAGVERVTLAVVGVPRIKRVPHVSDPLPRGLSTRTVRS